MTTPSPMKHRRTGACLAIVGTLLFLPAGASAYTRTSKWNQYLIPVLVCHGNFNNVSGNLNTKGNNVIHQIQNATQEWFVGGGAAIRLRYAGYRHPWDPECSSFANQPQYTIVVTADEDSISCEPVVTELAHDWLGNITKARITMFAGTSCGGSFQQYAWTTDGVVAASAQQLDWWAHLMNAFGFALGFATDNTHPSVMNYPVANFPPRRTLTADDRAGLRYDTNFGYGDISTTPELFTSGDLGQTWSSSTKPTSRYSVGSPAIAGATAASPAPIAVAMTTVVLEAPEGQRNKIYTFATDGISEYVPTTHGYTSRLPPAIACGESECVLAFVSNESADVGEIVIGRSSNLSQWTYSATGFFTNMRPALAYASRQNIFILIWNEGVGQRGLWSAYLASGGGVFGSKQIELWTTSHQFSISCTPGDRCYLDHVVEDIYPSACPPGGNDLTNGIYTAYYDLQSGTLAYLVWTRPCAHVEISMGTSAASARAPPGSATDVMLQLSRYPFDGEMIKDGYDVISYRSVARTGIFVQTPPMVAYDAARQLWIAARTHDGLYGQ